MAKRTILLVIVQTIFFNLYAIISSAKIPGQLVNSLAIGGILIALFSLGYQLSVIKWTIPSLPKDKKVLLLSQILLPLVFVFAWVIMLL